MQFAAPSATAWRSGRQSGSDPGSMARAWRPTALMPSCWTRHGRALSAARERPSRGTSPGMPGPYGRVVLAGGLDATNVAQAARTACPWGVDSSSRLEARPRFKDPEKVAGLLAGRSLRQRFDGFGVPSSTIPPGRLGGDRALLRILCNRRGSRHSCGVAGPRSDAGRHGARHGALSPALPRGGPGPGNDRADAPDHVRMHAGRHGRRDAGPATGIGSALQGGAACGLATSAAFAAADWALRKWGAD